jgi:cysteinyl-tRNA synthetase
MLKTHYLQPIDWTVQALKEAFDNLTYLLAIENFRNVKVPGVENDNSNAQMLMKEFEAALLDDLNTPSAFSVLMRGAKHWSREQLQSMLQLVGIDLSRFQLARNASERAFLESSHVDEIEIQSLITARLEARKAKNWAESDRIRDELAAMGIAIKDNRDGTTSWEVKR